MSAVVFVPRRAGTALVAAGGADDELGHHAQGFFDAPAVNEGAAG